MALRNERNNQAFLQQRLHGTRFSHATWVTETGSTNADLEVQARLGAPEQVLVTDLQTTGRGRRNRVWTAPPRTGVLMSLLIRDTAPADGFWAVGAVALAASQTIDAITTTACTLKWPNDVMLMTDDGQKKVAGVLAQVVDDGVIVGIGINANWPDQVPAELAQNGTAINRHLRDGPACERAQLAADVIERAIGHLESGREELRSAWKAQCSTLGQRVRLERHADAIVGVATDIGADGSLQIEEDGITSQHHVGDIVHLRPAT